jgi:hypothetical protein
MGETGTATELSTTSNVELIEQFERMQGEIAAHPPPGFNLDEWNALAGELVSRIPGASSSF